MSVAALSLFLQAQTVPNLKAPVPAPVCSCCLDCSASQFARSQFPPSGAAASKSWMLLASRKNAWATATGQNTRREIELEGFGLREAAAGKLRAEFPDVRSEQVDLFLHIPRSVCPPVYAIRLEWTDVHARIDFACAAAQQAAGDDPQAKRQLDEMIQRRTSFQQKATDIENYAIALGGTPNREDYRGYASLIELRRGTPGHLQFGHLVEPMDTD